MVRSLFVAVFALSSFGGAWAQTEQAEPPVKPPKQESKLVKWVKDQVLSRVTVSGYRRFGYHNHIISGDREAFNIGNYGGLGGQRFTDMGYVRVNGRNVFGALNFEFNIQDSRFEDPQGSRFSIDLQRGPWELNLGDIRGRLLNTNRFTRFDRTLRGVNLAYKAGPLEFRALRTEPRGEARTISLNGNNTAGPYYLQASQIIRGTERIEVDGVLQTFGQDYTIDYDLGAITFINRQSQTAKIIPPTSTIVATYEAFGFQGESGRIEGAGVSYNMGKYGRFGVTALRQVTGGDARVSTRTERFQGFGPASTPYFLQFEPMPGQPIVVRLDGIVQTNGIDYRFDLQNPAIFYFNRFVPSTSTIDVIYVPKPTNNVSGDREALGFDYQIGLGKEGKAGSLTLSQATGKLTNTLLPTSGTARGADLRYRWGKFDLSAGVRDIPDGYVSVETTGFYRNERATDLRLGYTPSPKWAYTTSYLNSSIVNRQSTGAKVTTRFTRAMASVGFTPSAGGSPWTLSHIRTAARNLSGETQIDTTALETSKTFGRLESRLALENQEAHGPLAGSTTGERLRVGLQTLNFRNTYRAHEDWNFNLNTSLSRISSQGKSGIGRDILFGVNYQPDADFSTRLEIADSESGPLSTLGQFNSGYGFGYDGNGFSGGATGGFSAGASDARIVNLSTIWAPNQRLALNGNVGYVRSSGSVSSNTETKMFSFGANYDLGKSNRVSGSIDYSKTDYIDSPFSSSATNISFFLDGSPGRFSYNIGLSSLLAGGNSTFKQDALNYEVLLSYQLASRHNLSFLARNGRTTGYYPQDDNELALTYQYRIWKSLALNFSYRIRDVVNRDPILSTGGYRSRGFDIELAFNFGQ